MKQTFSIIICGALISACSNAANCNDTDNDTYNKSDVVKYERWVEELKARNALSRSLLEERTDIFERAVISLESRLQAQGDTVLDDIKAADIEFTNEQKIYLFDAMNRALNSEDAE